MLFEKLSTLNVVLVVFSSYLVIKIRNDESAVNVMIDMSTLNLSIFEFLIMHIRKYFNYYLLYQVILLELRTLLFKISWMCIYMFIVYTYIWIFKIFYFSISLNTALVFLVDGENCTWTWFTLIVGGDKPELVISTSLYSSTSLANACDTSLLLLTEMKIHRTRRNTNKNTAKTRKLDPL